MNKHYLFNLDPQAKSDWDRCVLRNPLTGERPDLNELVAEAVNHQAGSYLIKVSLQVEILEQRVSLPNKTVELSTGKKSLIPEKRLASYKL
ncbi:MAG: hypothetical protein ACFCU7_11515 [Pleurocapsa sp.]